MANRLCKTCGTSFPARHEPYGKAFCSDACRTSKGETRRACRGCLESSARHRMVTFKDGTRHVQRYCMDCRKTGFVSHWIGYELGLCEKPKRDIDFMTDAGRQEPEIKLRKASP